MADDDPGFLARLSRAVVWLSLVVFLTGLAAAGYFAWRLSRDTAETFADPVAQFKYGSTGGDRNFGIPYAMWEAMPTLFRDLLPEGREDEGWAAFGFLYEDPADLPPELRHPRPVGTSLRNNMGIDRIFLNCAGCHAGSVRTGPGGAPLIVAGMPSNTVDLSAFQGFLAEAAVDERFSADRFLSEIDARGHRARPRQPPGAEVRRHRHGPRAPARHRRPLRRLRPQRADLRPRPLRHLQPGQGAPELGLRPDPRGRAHRRRRLPLGLPAGPEGGHAAALGRQQHQGLRAQPLRRLRHRRHAADPRPRLARSAWRTGSPPPSRRAFADVFPAQFDAALAAEGAPVYARECAACHGASGRDFTGEYVGKVTPIGEVGTDRGRLDNYTHDLAVNQNVLYAEFGSERFQTFRKTDGYANAPLDGLWLRAPYLHNGSVPTLAALLSPPAERPARLPARLRRLRPAGDGLRERPRPHRPGGRGRASSATSPAPTPPPLCPAGGAADERHLRRRPLPRQRQRRPPLGHRRSRPPTSAR